MLENQVRRNNHGTNYKCLLSLCGRRGGGTPLEIYNGQKQWIRLNTSDTNNAVFFHDNGNGTAQLVGGVTNGSITLPNGYVGNGNQTFGNTMSFNNYVSDGSNQVQYFYFYGNGANSLQLIKWTINVRKTN